MARLKVFRTTVGFHDAFVAVPSRAAALRAWRASTDLFAMGAAEEVVEPELMAAALSNPGAIVRKSRGTLDDHLTAPGPAKRRPTKKDVPSPRTPRPSRSKLTAAEQRLAEAEASYETSREQLNVEIERLETHRRKIQREHEAKLSKLRKGQADEKRDYDDALGKWQGE